MATTTLVIAANAPDVDMFSYMRGEYFALAFRRGITHGWPALIVLPFVVAGGVLAWDRWVRLRRNPDADPARPRQVVGLAALGVLTHPTLDWMNTYGMRWTLPFDGTWTYGDALFIIDPWIWLGMGGAVFLSTRWTRRGVVGWGFLAALTGSLTFVGGGLAVAVAFISGLIAIALLHSTVAPIGRRTVGVAGAVIVAYICFMVAADAGARRHVEAAARDAGLVVEDVMTAPLPASPLRTEVEVLTPQGFVPGAHSWLGSPRVELRPSAMVPLLEAPAGLRALEVEGIIESARSQPNVRNYLVWSRYPYVRVSRRDEGWLVRFADARYDGRPEAGGLAGVDAIVADPEDP